MASEKIVHLTDENFDSTISEGTVLVDFWAQWCGPCVLMNRSISELAKENVANVAVAKVDTMLHPSLAGQYAVSGLPTVIIFKSGKQVNRKTGSLTRQQLNEMIEKI